MTIEALEEDTELSLALPDFSEDTAIRLSESADRSDLRDKDTDTLGAEARYHREQAETTGRQMLYHWVEVGRRLIEVNSRPEFRLGDFVGWAQEHVGVGQASAYRYMKLARPENLSRVINLPPDTSLRQAIIQVDEVRKEERREKQAAARAERSAVITPDEALPIDCKIDIGDAAAIPLDDETVELIVTSPPYNLGKDYANAEDNRAYQTYLIDVEKWTQELFRIAKSRGRICLNIPLDITRGGLQPIYSDWLNCLLDAGWKYKCSIVWNEGNVTKSFARGSIDSPIAPHIFAPVEMIIVCYKDEWHLHRGGQHTLQHEDWLDWTNGLWTFPGENRNVYPAAFPEELPKRCINLLSFSDAVVCDPFLGSGTSAVAAVRLGRSFVGFDISEEAVNIARSRLALMGDA